MSRPGVAALAGLAAMLAAAAPAGCGSSSGGAVTAPAVAPAKVYALGDFAPAGTVAAGRPTTLRFTVQLPSGRALTSFKTGSGPHTGVHLIIVRDDLAYIIHDHPPITPNGVLRQTVTFPAPGPYHVLADVYPNIPGGQPNFQLVRTVHVAGPYRRLRGLPPFRADQVVDGYHFDLQGHPALRAIQAAFVHVVVTDPHGRPVKFAPWFGALAHAIFFRAGSLAYFHTHVCAVDAVNCGSLGGLPTRITGRSTAPGKITVGVLLPEGGTWRLFLQMRVHGQVLTAPYTLRVGS